MTSQHTRTIAGRNARPATRTRPASLSREAMQAQDRERADCEALYAIEKFEAQLRRAARNPLKS